MHATKSPTFSLIHDISAFPQALKEGVVAIGNFDGVHRGHRAVLDAALALGHGASRKVYAMTFEPHPRTFFSPGQPIFRLTPPQQKADLLAATGLDGVLQLPFTRELAGMEAEDFVQSILIDTLQITHAVTGYDFHFGKARRGTPSFLSAAGETHGFGVTIVAPQGDEGDGIISSSRIRKALQDGELALANGLLGYRWFVDAEVQHGDKRGRDLGYPTANLRLQDGCPLKHGVYAVRVKTDDTWHDGVASFGRRPTFDNGAPLLEVHLFDMKADLYGKELRVHMVSYLRSELKFDNIDALIVQMDQDSAEARAALASLQPLSDLDQSLMPMVAD